MPPAEWLQKADEESDAKRPRRSCSHLVRDDSYYIRRSIQSVGGLLWSAADIAMAARLFSSTNTRHPTVVFAEEEEKRRVFTLVYDVLRYKSILNKALSDLHFFKKHPQFQERYQHVWLLFFDLYKRDFSPRDALDAKEETEFQEQGLFEIEIALWNTRVRLAATVARLRIKNGAHSLSMLIPQHLQQKKSTLEEAIITGWVNGFRNSVKDVCKAVENVSISSLPKNEDDLHPMTYKTDHLLPRFIHIMPSSREDIVHLPIVLNHHLILQERTFCIGPAVMAQLLKDFALTGIVAQTHVNSIVTMAYFANLLVNNEKIEKLHVFGAGKKRDACIQYLKHLGVNNTEVHEDNFADLSPDNHVLNNVIGVLATPPNTNSSVIDPVDLALARGGDLELLHQLTVEDLSRIPSREEIEHLLTEQQETLRRAMSKPQIQFIVYETHSRFESENSEMTNVLIEELNTYARDMHLEELKKSQGEKQSEQPEKPEGEQTAEDKETLEKEKSIEHEEPPAPLPNIVVPLSDLFELGTLPNLCPGNEKCLNLQSEGVYLALIKRKEITRLDPKYMIKMAESRGLFGRSEGSKQKQQSGQSSKAKATLAALQNRSDSLNDSKKGNKIKVEMERIAAPTRSSFLKDSRTPVHVPDPCPRHAYHLSQDGKPKVKYNPRVWWKELSIYLLTYLSNPDVELPPLKLTRIKKRKIKLRKIKKRIRTPFPVSVNYLEFHSEESDLPPDSHFTSLSSIMCSFESKNFSAP
uniref:Uncharacterized protein n=1 Tax=Clastoptera arizonana TaxID=38151 RepID=A0A1B6EGC3_9HEMI